MMTMMMTMTMRITMIPAAARCEPVICISPARRRQFGHVKKLDANDCQALTVVEMVTSFQNRPACQW